MQEKQKYRSTRLHNESTNKEQATLVICIQKCEQTQAQSHTRLTFSKSFTSFRMIALWSILFFLLWCFDKKKEINKTCTMLCCCLWWELFSDWTIIVKLNVIHFSPVIFPPVCACVCMLFETNLLVFLFPVDCELSAYCNSWH